MKEDSAALRKRIEELEDRASRLSAAVLRVNSSLDLDTVLRAALAGARGLAGARVGMIATVDEAGAMDGFFESGFTPEESAELAVWPDRGRLFENLRGLSATLRVDNLARYVRDLGLTPSTTFSRAFQGTPMHYRGIDVGSFFLAEKEDGGVFTDADEAVLVLFASQAAAAIVNARTHRAERRARADLETLIDTSPVGVVVFNGKTGEPVSFNREVRRIVEGLSMPDRSLEQLLDLITCRRADGREISLGEFPLARQWSSPETVRAEEITLSIPDGRSITTLVNATPIKSANGVVESVVVTMQDLAPLDELEKLRAEFLSIVSHELRTPLISIKGATATVLGASPPVEPAEMLQFFRVIDEQADHMRRLTGELLDHGRIVTGTLSVSPAPENVSALVDQARSTFLSGAGNRDLSIDLPEDLPPVMADRARIVQVVNNLLSNAARNSPDSSPIRVAAERDGAQVAVSVADKGRGVPAEQLPNLFRRHIGAAGSDWQSGAGLGLVICKGLVEAHGGRIWAESGGAGRGTQLTFSLPVADAAGGGAAGPAPVGPHALPREKDTTRILVVDDDPQMLRYVRGALSGAGYTPVVTGDPEELPDLVRTHSPGLVLLDLLLPGKDGIALLEGVPELADLPVIFISAYGRDETIVRALDAGAADYIVKPFSQSELAARVRAALSPVTQ